MAKSRQPAKGRAVGVQRSAPIGKPDGSATRPAEDPLTELNDPAFLDGVRAGDAELREGKGLRFGSIAEIRAHFGDPQE